MTPTYAPPRTTRSAAPASVRRPRRHLALCLLPALIIAVEGYRRRWMADDAHIYVRTVRQILAGNGPVFNAGERAESSTGTLWQWLLAVAGLPGIDPPTAAVHGGLLLTAAGFLFAGFGATRLYRTGGPLLPLGSLILLALPPVWDFATSGLETGLTTCWLAGSWSRLVVGPRSYRTSFLLGLGPLVRPDLALVSAVFLAAQWLRARPDPRTTLTATAAALALPVAYEVFRAGYYGHLVPLPAVTKEASGTEWARGFDYLADFAGPYLLGVPALFVIAALLPRHGTRRRSVPLAPALAPVVAGALSWLYVIKVGGDFMHARMLLPGLLLMLLPVFAVPASRVSTCAALAIGVWAVGCAGWLRVGYPGRVGPAGIADERGVYVRLNGENTDIRPLDHGFEAAPELRAYARAVRTAADSRAPTLVIGDRTLPANAPSVTGVHLVLGFDGTVVPLSGAALDPIGLGYPLAAHSEREGGGRVGHDKHLPLAWILADRARDDTRASAGAGMRWHTDPGPRPLVTRDTREARQPGTAQVAAAREALRCGPLAELREATRAPLTPARFWHNLTGAWRRTAFRFPDDPVRARAELCARSASGVPEAAASRAAPPAGTPATTPGGRRGGWQDH